MADGTLLMKLRPSTSGNIFLYYQTKLPKRVRLLLLVAAAYLVWQLVLCLSNPDPIHERKRASPTEPNQTLWKELLVLEPGKLNLSRPTVSPLTSLLILVPLTAADQSRRQEIRDSWAHRNSSKAIQSGLATVLFVVGQNHRLDHQLAAENRKYKDILVTGGRLTDSYSGLVYKLLVAYRWVHSNYPQLEVAKLDSDVVVEVDRLFRAVNKEVRRKKFIMGYLWKNMEPHRDPFDPWYIPISAFPSDTLSLYANGPAYIFSSSALGSVLKAAAEQPVFEVEDALFTGVLAEKAKVDLVKLDGIFHKIPSNQRCEGDRPTLVAYPVHNTVLGVRQEYEKMKTISCKWWIQNLLGL